jgi:hypothetical protein
MESLFAQMFLALQAHIKQTVSEINYIDLDYGQLDIYEERPKVSFPCVLIDFPDANYKDELQNVQWADLLINIRIGFDTFGSSNSLVPDITREKALMFYEIENNLYKSLQQFDCGGITQPMTRIKAHTEKRHDPFRVRLLTFITSTEDNSAVVPLRKLSPKLKITN